MRVLVYLALPLFLLLACAESTTEPSDDTSTNETSETTDTTSDDETDDSESEVDEETTDDTNPEDQTDMAEPRAQATQMGMSIIQSYFDGDAEVFIAMLHHTLPQIGREGEAMDGEYFSDLIRHATPYPSGEDFTQYTMEEYQAVYDPLVLTFQEAVDQLGFPEVEGDGWVPEEGDFLFIGWNLKPESTETDKFIRDGLNSFVFGIRNGQWKFVGFIS